MAGKAVMAHLRGRLCCSPGSLRGPALRHRRRARLPSVCAAIPAGWLEATERLIVLVTAAKRFLLAPRDVVRDVGDSGHGPVALLPGAVPVPHLHMTSVA